MSTVILAIGFVIFLSHFLSLLFKKTNIPDVLILMTLGLVIGPLFHWVEPQDFGKVGSIIATIALVVILFESGTSLSLAVMARSLSATGKLTFSSFVLTSVLVALAGFYFLSLSLEASMLLGLILGGTSSAVVIPMVSSLRLGKKAGTVLVLESALTDVLSIVGVVAMLRIATEGGVEPGQLIGSVLASLMFAAILGVLGGIGWLMILGKVRDFPNTISATIAHAFLVYGVTEFLGFSGAIAVLTLGITLTNFEFMGLNRIKAIDQSMEPLTSVDLAFYKEAVFLLKTYFFVYLGISIRFNEHSVSLIAGAVVLIAVVFLGRTLFVRGVMRDSDYSLRDGAMASVLAPKGLAAAVLAGVPLQYGVVGGELIRDAAYMVVLVSITMSALLVMAYPLPPLQRFYALLIGKERT